jgi:hypothetical protein
VRKSPAIAVLGRRRCAGGHERERECECGAVALARHSYSRNNCCRISCQ